MAATGRASDERAATMRSAALAFLCLFLLGGLRCSFKIRLAEPAMKGPHGLLSTAGGREPMPYFAKPKFCASITVGRTKPRSNISFTLLGAVVDGRQGQRAEEA